LEGGEEGKGKVAFPPTPPLPLQVAYPKGGVGEGRQLGGGGEGKGYVQSRGLV